MSSRKFFKAIAANLADCEKQANHINVTAASTSTIPGRKAFKKSSLRQSLTFDDEQDSNGSGDGVNKATIGRSISTFKKKKPAASRLSFGPGEVISGDAAEALKDDETFTLKKAIGRRVIESNALSKSIPFQVPKWEEDGERPTYSKDYLNELKSSTPTAPKDLGNLKTTADDEAGLDVSELEGAIIVDIEETGPAHIPSEAEIREKKERRARLAREQDFISFNDEGSGRQLSFLPQRKKAESRLVREDEDIGEGFDEFVDDGKISLGKKQEREARRQSTKRNGRYDPSCRSQFGGGRL